MKTVKEIIQVMEHLQKTEKNSFKKRAFKNAIDSLNTHLKQTDEIDDLSKVENLPGIGKGILTRIEKILEEKLVADNDELLEVHGIGPTKLQSLSKEHGITTIAQLRKNQHLLNDKQKLGLKYVKSTMQRIPRKEMIQHNNYIKKNIRSKYPNLEIELTGSYRRKKEESGDIDVLIKNDGKINLKDIVQLLTDKGYILPENFAQGNSKFLGLAKLKSSENIRRIDLLLIDEDQYPFALLYFTGSKEFNIICRQAALNNNLTLNEHGLVNNSNAVNAELKTEKDILKFIGVPYRVPEKR
jgi:DNA polymerase/3'-5' exonuclease PolX